MIDSIFAKKIEYDTVAEKTCGLRFITATSLFDGHDASINIMRRILQAEGAEVIHLGHNRSASELVAAAIQEDVQGIAVSSYQGGHLEYYQYLIDLLREQQADSIKVFGGGGGVILPKEIKQLQDYGVTRIYSSEDGQRMGLRGMISNVIALSSQNQVDDRTPKIDELLGGDWRALAKILSDIENDRLTVDDLRRLKTQAINHKEKVPILGVTGTGGSGKSSVIDELVRRFRIDFDDSLRIAIVAVDPSRKKTGGALLGDRLRMNAIDSSVIFMRSMATRGALTELPEYLSQCLSAIVACNFDLVIVETPGIGQADSGIVRHVDAALYVMTPEYGAASQLEKTGMLDFADVVAINKFDRRGGQDALHDVRKQIQRNRGAFSMDPAKMPVFGTVASQTNNDGMTALYQSIRTILATKGLKNVASSDPCISVKTSMQKTTLVPPSRQGYLSEIAETGRAYRQRVKEQSQVAHTLQQLIETKKRLPSGDTVHLDKLIQEFRQRLDRKAKVILDEWPKTAESYCGDEIEGQYRNKSVGSSLSYTSPNGIKIPRVALPTYLDHGDLLKWLMLENLPGFFPFTAGVFRFKRQDEESTRMFAGEGCPSRTNRRFKYLCSQSAAKRLSTAFDSVTLYGWDPDDRPDIYGRIGNSGVSVACLDDMKELFDGFDLSDPKTSVSMTINGPAGIILAMFFNAAIDQQLAIFEDRNRRPPDREEFGRIQAQTFKTIRGTVQADILKEDQGQNTCIFSTEFSLKLMGDIQEFFIQNGIRHFYSASISGYHMAEAGANPITQLAFTLANGFTYVEAFLARGMAIDDFVRNLSFFFSNGMDPEFSVIGRVARRIWAVAMRDLYGANERSQKLKYHIQTSGRSLHAQAMEFNDVRTTLQALIAVYDNCNSLHTNASDEAVTTPTAETVRQAMAIQMIINREWGLAKNENPNQGAFVIEQLTDLVEQAVLREFERISERGGVLGAMETGYQRNKIQEESLDYESAKYDGRVPIVGVNLFQNLDITAKHRNKVARSSDVEKRNQIRRVCDFKRRYQTESKIALERLSLAAVHNDNIFSHLMSAVRVCTLGQITDTLFKVGGRYRRNM